MEIFVVFIIILVYCLILNVNLHYILSAILILSCIFLICITLCFLFWSILLLFSKPKEARFIRMDKGKFSKFQVAYYLVEGQEYPCIFPEEGIMRDKLYQEDKLYHVMLHKKMRIVYDRFAIATCLLGSVFSIGLSTLMVFFVLGMG